MTLPEFTFSAAILGAYYLTLGILAVYGLHRLVLLGLYYRTRDRLNQPLPAVQEWPIVTVQLPLFNERYVARRLIDSVCRMRYPRSRLQIQVLDDSTDGTTEVAAERVDHYRRQGIDIDHVRRSERHGFKAGALKMGLEQARGELLAIFDADFVPGPEFLEETIPCFDDPEVGMVQARWDHLNRDYSLLTRIQAIFLDGHFAIEHAARNINGFKGQQFRWAKGSVQTARKLLRRILRAPVPLGVKLESFIHLTNNASYVLMVLLSLLVFPAMLLRRDTDPKLLLFIDLPLFLAATVSVVLYYVVSQIAVNPDWWHDLRFLPSLMGLGIGLSVNNAGAVMSGLMHHGGVFERTPKYGIESKSDRWRDKSYGAKPDRSVALERALTIYSVGCFVLAWKLEMWWSIPFLLLFVQGYIYMTVLSIVPPKRMQASASDHSIELDLQGVDPSL
ncbi:MAG: glycosyltransferase [Acidobacteriota bacterium]